MTSGQYPADRADGGVGQTGTFTLTPSTTTNDTAYYLYSLTEQGGDPVTRATPSTFNGSANIQWTPTLSGPQTLSVQAVDRAGNRSDTVQHRIIVSDFQVGISGKVAQWSLESSLVDSSDAKSLTYHGPPPGPTFAPGHQGQGVALDFNFTDFYQAKDALVRTDSSFAVSAWTKLDRTDRHYVIASQDGESQSGFYLQYHADVNRWAMVMSARDTDVAPVWYPATSTSAPVPGVWTHLAGVFDASARKVRLYVNGQLNGETDVPLTWNATGPFVVGAGMTGGSRDYHFSGNIDSTRVHSRALTGAEVDALFRGTATANPAAEYLFENNLNNTGANNDLAPAGTPTFAPGYAANALQVNTPTGPLGLSAGPLVSTSGAYSVAGWVKLVDKNDFYVIASQDGSRRAGFVLRYSRDSDRWMFGMPMADTDSTTMIWATSQQVPQTGVWTHLAAVHDAARRKLLLYVNGVLDAQRDLTSTPDARGQFVLGAEQANGTRIGRFKGSLDEFNVYDGALNAGEVANLANAPVERARYRLDETSGTVARDSVGAAQAPLYGNGITWGQNFGAASANFDGNATGHAGTIPGAGPLARWDLNNRLTDASGNGRTLVHGNNTGPTPVTYGSARINEGVSLNGVDQRLTTTGAVVDTSRSYSVSAWVHLNRNNDWFTVASQDGATASPFYLQYDPALNRWRFGLTDEDRVNPGGMHAASKLPPELNTWTHLLGVYDAQAGRVRLFVNGQLEGDAPFTAVWQSMGSFAIGRAKWNGSPANFFPGRIDEVRVYDRALTASDAHGLWNLNSNFTVPRPTAFRTDQSFVLAAWVRPNGYDANSRQVLAADGNRFGPLVFGYRAEWRRWGVLAEHGSEATGVGRWVLSDNEAATYADQDGWIHLAAVYDAPARTVRLYVNGLRQRTIPTGGTTVALSDSAGRDITLWDGGRDLLIGRTTWLGQAVDSWKGAIREVRVFSGVLPEACDNTPTCMSQLPFQ